METVRKISKPTAIFLTFYMLMLACPYQSAWAALIGTDSIINENRGHSPREYLNNLLAREDIQKALVSQGIDPQEAQARIDSLDIVNKLDQLPAGGVLGTLLIIAFLVFVILLLTDIAGYTDIFPFVKKK